MRLSEQGWSNDVPDAPGWYSFCSTKEWDWWPGTQYPVLARVDFSNGVLKIVECDNIDELPHVLDVPWHEAANEDQHWMNRAWKPLRFKAEFDEDDLPDVSGNRCDAPDEYTVGDKRKTNLRK